MKKSNIMPTLVLGTICLTVALYKKKAVPVAANDADESDDEE